MVRAGSRDFLRLVGRNDADCLQWLLNPAPEGSVPNALGELRLDCRTRSLVRLAALLALGAAPTTLQWAVELASGSGVGDGEIVATLLAVGSAEGIARLADGAAPLALALGYGE